MEAVAKSESAKNPILTVSDLVKEYPGGVRALRGVSFTVYPGEFVAIVGLSGSGKSTLLRCVNRLIEPSRGKILFDGEEITRLRAKDLRRARKKIGMVFQQFNLIKRTSALNNALCGRLGFIPVWRTLVGFWGSLEKAGACEMLQSVGLAEKENARASHLSGGEQQRVAVARALLQEPKLLLADEPVANLDPALGASVMRYLQWANQEMGMTVLCNLHTVSLVKRYAHRVIALKGGEKIFDGFPYSMDDTWFKRVYGEESQREEG